MNSDVKESLATMSKGIIPSMFEARVEEYSNNLLAHHLNALLFNNTPNSTVSPDVTSDFDTTAAFAFDNSTLMDAACNSSQSFILTLRTIRFTVGLMMVLENCLSLLALWHVKRMQTSVHRFISSLAVAELLMGVWNCYRYGAEFLLGSDVVDFECRLRFIVHTYANFTAILSVCALCLDRCIALHFPFRYVELVTKRRMRIALGFVWFLPLLFVLTAYADTTATCQECSFVSIASQRTYIVLTVVRCVLISLIIVCELLIFRSARLQIVKIYPNVFSSRNSSRLLRMNAKAAITTLAVVIPFFILYTPVLFVQGNLAVHPESADTCQSQILACVWLFASMHGLFTPFIFCWRFTEVRENLFRLLRCRSPRPSPMNVFHVRTNDSGVTV